MQDARITEKALMISQVLLAFKNPSFVGDIWNRANAKFTGERSESGETTGWAILQIVLKNHDDAGPIPQKKVKHHNWLEWYKL